MRTSKEIFYVLLSINNLIALFFIGISFLAGPSAIRDSAKGFMYTIDPIYSLFIYVGVVSLISSSITTVLLYFNRAFFAIRKNTFIRYFTIQFVFLVAVFSIVQGYIYLRY